MTPEFTSDALTRALRDAGELVSVHGRLPGMLRGVTDDSRQVTPGSLFIAIRGTVQDGHAYLGASRKAGAAATLVERDAAEDLPTLVVRDSRRAAGIAAAAAYGDPARSLTIVGVTGTSGKTTTVHILRHLLDDAGAAAASVGTLGVLVGGAGRAMPGGSGLTTPGPVELQRVLRRLADAGVRRVAMEVSSHSLDQHRVSGVVFTAAVFTNLTHEHLDYHETMDAYFQAKARLVTLLDPGGVVIVNADAGVWDALPNGHRRVRFGLGRVTADVSARAPRYSARGSDWTLVAGGDAAAVKLPLLGDFNVGNALAAAAAAWALGTPAHTIAERLATVPQVPGRLELLHEHPTVLRDYAHKPDALRAVLRALQPFVPGRLIVVFGCGGDRDRAKRPVMGAIAEANADVVILTSDNPRTEDPERILDEIEAGMTRPHERIEDRRTAIARALSLARAGDMVLLAGKGHETYQLRGTETLPFDEREVVGELMSANAGGGAHA